MKRIEFLRTSFLGVAGFTLISPFLSGSSGKQVMPGNWAWMDGSIHTSLNQWKELFDKLLNANISGLLINGSNEVYEKIGPLSLQSGIQVHAWRWTMNRGDYMKEHPEWYTVNRLGNSVVDKPPYVHYYRWLCPSRPEVKDLLVKNYSGLAQITGIRGVHLDYVRYCDIFLPVGLLPKYNLVQDFEMPEFDYCYCPLCRSIFKQKSGYDPMDQKDPDQDRAWHQFRLDQLVNVVQEIAKAVHHLDSVITAAVFPTPEMSRRMVRQDWSRFELDAYLPMLYHEYYQKPTDWIGECVTDIRKEIGGSVPVYAGIMVNPRTFTPAVLAKTIRQVKEAGGQGISAFTAGGLTKEQLQTLRRDG
ncbi:MAG: hypothetical protein NTV01_01445 [Bacteroidia bacterium]|nr:hypothetical protein [Bacteroidia bacterium]